MIGPRITVKTRLCSMASLFLLGAFFPGYLRAAPLGQNANDEAAGHKQPLGYRLIVSKPTVCLKETIELELELENTSNRKIVIDPSLWAIYGSFARASGPVRRSRRVKYGFVRD